MRDWGIHPKYLHRQHLLGNHAELHYLAMMLRGERKTCEGKPLQWFIDQGAVDPSVIHERHNELVQEMANRGYQHKSPLPLLPAHLPIGSINKEHNYEYLRNNCAQCEERIKEYGNN